MKTFTNSKMITSQKFSVCGSYLHYKRNLVHFHGLDIINTAMMLNGNKIQISTFTEC